MTIVGEIITRCSVEVMRSPSYGLRTVTVYEGSRAACEGFAFQLPAGLEWKIEDSQAPKCSLTVSAPYLDAGNTSAEPPENIWELLGNALQKDIYEHPRSLALGSIVLSQIKASVQAVQTATGSAATVYSEQTGKITAATQTANVSQADALSLFDLILKGQTSYQVSQYVVRHTRIVSTKSSVRLAMNNVEQVYTAGQVNYEAAIPAGILFSITSIPTVTPQTGYSWGWLKQTPTIHMVAGGQYEMVNEWWLEQWASYLYRNSNSPSTPTS